MKLSKNQLPIINYIIYIYIYNPTKKEIDYFYIFGFSVSSSSSSLFLFEIDMKCYEIEGEEIKSNCFFFHSYYLSEKKIEK